MVEKSVGSVPVVVREILGEHDLEVAAVEDKESVQALPADGTDESLGDRVGAGRLDRGLDNPDALGGEDGVEGAGELGVAVADQELDRRRALHQLEADVPCLLGDPGRRRIGSDAGPERLGEGSMRWRPKIAQTLQGARVTPMVASSPWMRR